MSAERSEKVTFAGGQGAELASRVANELIDHGIAVPHFDFIGPFFWFGPDS